MASLARAVMASNRCGDVRQPHANGQTAAGSVVARVQHLSKTETSIPESP
jgi:hypothetical protein